MNSNSTLDDSAEKPAGYAGLESGAIKHYELRACLKVTSSTQVFEAWDTQLHRTVVIKHIKYAHLSPAARRMLLQQLRLAASLKHLAFVKIHAIDEDGDSLFIVMEMVTGLNLKDWVQAHRGNERMALRHIVSLLAAMQEAHLLGLGQSEIKPTDLIIDSSGKIRILNFGLETHAEFQAENQSGTSTSINLTIADSCIAYRAPERLKGNAVTPATHVFTIGSIWYEMLCGNLPHADLQGLALIVALVQTHSDQWPWPPSVSPEYKRLILAMTAQEATLRCTNGYVIEQIKLLTASDPLSQSADLTELIGLGQQLNARKAKLRYYLLAGIIALSLVGGLSIWQLNPNWNQITKTLMPFSVSQQLELGMQALSQYDKPKMLDKAATHFNAVLQRDPDNARAVAGLSIVYGHHFRSSNRDEVWREKALASAQQAISLNPDIGVVQTAYALALDPQQNFETAMKAVRRAKELEPNSLLVWQSELRILLYARQFADVILIADKALELFPNDWLILNLKGTVYLNQAKYQMAENIFRSSVQHHPEVTLSYSSLSMALESQGRIEESLQVLQQGLQIRPDVNLYKRIGQIKFSQGDYQAAVDILRSATLSSPGQFEVWHSFADALMQIPGKENEALSAYRKTQELLEIVHKRRPNDGWFLATLALVEARLKNLSYARKLIRRSLELTPNNPNVYVLAASVYELNGQRAEALAALQTARKLGFSEAQLQADPVFKELRKDPAY